MKRLLLVPTICFFALLAIASETQAGGFDFSAYDIVKDDYLSPSFRFAIKFPDGSLAGWDRNASDWTGSITESKVSSGVISYPTPSVECSSVEPEVRRETSIPPDILVDYTMRNALYCRSVLTGNNFFIGSGYGVSIGDAGDATYEITFYPERDGIIYVCFDFSTDGPGESPNTLCTNETYIKRLILSDSVEQKVEFIYSFSAVEGTTLKTIASGYTLAGSWETCQKLGLIRNSGLYTSIQKKFENATRKVEAGDTAAANNIYAALANELEAQHGKGIDATCASILIEDLRAGVR